MAKLPQLMIVDNVAGWGPPMVVEDHKFSNIPYAAFSKNDKLGRACDWTQFSRGPGGRERFGFGRGRQDRSDPSTAVFNYDAVDDDGFHLVDSKPAPKPKWGPGRRIQQQRALQQKQNQQDRRDQAQTTGRPFQPAVGSRGKFARGREKDWNDRRWGGRDKQQRAREPSVQVRSDWELKTEISLSALTKLAYEVDPPEDLKRCGAVRYFNQKAMDRITTKSDVKLQRADKYGAAPNTLDDPVIQQLASQGQANVFATDAILAVLMSAHRSVYSWDIVFERAGEHLFFYSRPDSNLESISVNETAHEPPDDENKEGANSADRLDAEATMINRSFIQQSLMREGKPLCFPEPSPFDEYGSEKAYRYRHWLLEKPGLQEGDDLVYNNLVVRCEVDGALKTKEGTDALLTIKCLNEFDPKAKDSVDWRQKLDSQPGAVLATQLKNNSNKLGRWACQALLTGADLIRIGYVSRLNPRNPNDHVILGCKQFKPQEFATQVSVSESNAWGALKAVIDECLRLPEGKYVLLKDPNNPIIQLYEVPANAFEEELEEEAPEDDDGIAARSDDED
mmetsp:Transcript_32868/g.75164  ORF Transcript_32868/g.75164 Transcript_32868/m.75164 type:complete len:564 (-) Transcript_32868:43-1734(-)